MSRVSEPLDISQKKESKEAINPLPPQSTSINGSFIDFNVCHLCSFDLKVTFNLKVYLVNKSGKKGTLDCKLNWYSEFYNYVILFPCKEIFSAFIKFRFFSTNIVKHIIKGKFVYFYYHWGWKSIHYPIYFPHSYKH